MRYSQRYKNTCSTHALQLSYAGILHFRTLKTRISTCKQHEINA